MDIRYSINLTASLQSQFFQIQSITHSSSETNNRSRANLASFDQRAFEVPLPYPIGKVEFTYATLCDPYHPVKLVQFLSVTIHDVFGQQIAYFQKLDALAEPRHGWNPVHGRDPGPPPPSTSITPIQPPPPYSTISPPDPNAMPGRGFNTFHGFDNGPPPPGFGPAQPAGVAQFAAFSAPPAAAPLFAWGASQAVAPAFAPVLHAHPPTFIMQPNFGNVGLGGNTYPTIAPIIEHGFPGIHLRNHTGGVGLPPGYDYAFPQEHCKIHVFKTALPPWQNNVFKEDPSSHVKLFVPTTATVKELMQNLGCTNSDPKKNILHEISEIGGGRWAKGLTIAGDDKDRMKKPISAFGWDKSRTGSFGERPVVWLWATKD